MERQLIIPIYYYIDEKGKKHFNIKKMQNEFNKKIKQLNN